MRLLISSVESMPWDEVYKSWCDARYNIVERLEIQDPLELEVAPGQREHPTLVAILDAQLRDGKILTSKTRRWSDPNDKRLGLLVDTKEVPADKSPFGPVSFRVLGKTWIEVYVRAQLILHLLEIDTHFHFSNFN